MALLTSRVLNAPKEGRGMYTADRRIYLDAAGKVVEANDPNKATLLVAKGGTLPLDRARELGLTKEADAPSKSAREERAAAAPPAKAEAPKKSQR